jgi:hypothetical protein
MGGMGGLGGMGGSPPTCTTADMPGSLLWSKQFGGEGVPGTAHQRITRLIQDPEGIVVMAQYTEALTTPGFTAPGIGGSGHAFLLWVTPGGPFVQDGGTAKNVLFLGPTIMGGPPEPRAIALGSAPYRLAVAGQFNGSLQVSGNTISAPSSDPAPFTIAWDGAAGTPKLVGSATAGQARLDDVVIAIDGATIASGYTQNGMTVDGVVFPPGHFIARIETAGVTAAVGVGLGVGAGERIYLAQSPAGDIYLAATLGDGSYTLAGDTLEVVALSGVLVARIEPDLSFTAANVFQGPDATGHQAFVRDLNAGPEGSVAVSGSFFGELSFEPNTAKVISTASLGQNDGFVVVVDPSLEATRWFGFGSTATPEVVASVSIDPCGDVAVMGTLRDVAMFGSTPVDPISPTAAYVAKLDASAEGALSPAWIALLDHANHVVCSSTVDPFWDQPCLQVLATEEGVYVAGGFGGEIDLLDGVPIAASQGEDAYLLKLAP